MAEPTNERGQRREDDLPRVDPPEESRTDAEATADRDVENYRDEYDSRERYAGDDVDQRS